MCRTRRQGKSRSHRRLFLFLENYCRGFGVVSSLSARCDRHAPPYNRAGHYVDVIGVFYRRFAILGMNARRSGKLSTCLSDPEIIHAGKNKRVLGLKNVPKIEVDHGPVEGKLLPEMLEDMTGEFEAEKFQLVLT